MHGHLRGPTPTEVHQRLAGAHDRIALGDPAVVESQIAVAEIAAPTGDESERGAWMARRFESLGLCDIDIDTVGNVVGRRPGARPDRPVAICAHLDTVFPRGTNLSVRRE